MGYAAQPQARTWKANCPQPGDVLALAHQKLRPDGDSRRSLSRLLPLNWSATKLKKSRLDAGRNTLEVFPVSHPSRLRRRRVNTHFAPNGRLIAKSLTRRATVNSADR